MYNNILENNEFKIRAIKSGSTSQGLDSRERGHAKSRACYTLLNPVNYKTNIRGYWTNDKGRVYKDNFILDKHNSWRVVKRQSIDLCKVKNQLCIFVKKDNKGFIINRQGMVSSYFKSKRIIVLKSKGDRKSVV